MIWVCSSVHFWPTAGTVNASLTESDAGVVATGGGVVVAAGGVVVVAGGGVSVFGGSDGLVAGSFLSSVAVPLSSFLQPVKTKARAMAAASILVRMRGHYHRVGD